MGLVLLSLDIATVDGPGVQGQGTPVTQIVKVREGEMDPATAAALLRAQADRLDPPEPKVSTPHLGHTSTCRCAGARPRTLEDTLSERPPLPGAMPTVRSAGGERLGPQGDGRAVDRE